MIAEVAKTFRHHRREPPLFFWRDPTGHEVDLLVDESSNLHPVEMKSGQTMDSGSAAGIRRAGVRGG